VNERIEKLAEQATTYIDPIANDGVCWNFDKEKFALLIVAECVGIVENLSPGYKDYRDQIEDAFRRDCVIEIKKHFGVEE